MSTNLHKAWEASLLVCELLGLNSKYIAEGGRPFTSQEGSKPSDQAVDLALALRREVFAYEQKKYFLAKHPL